MKECIALEVSDLFLSLCGSPNYPVLFFGLHTFSFTGLHSFLYITLIVGTLQNAHHSLYACNSPTSLRLSYLTGTIASVVDAFVLQMWRGVFAATHCCVPHFVIFKCWTVAATVVRRRWIPVGASGHRSDMEEAAEDVLPARGQGRGGIQTVYRWISASMQ